MWSEGLAFLTADGLGGLTADSLGGLTINASHPLFLSIEAMTTTPLLTATAAQVKPLFITPAASIVPIITVTDVAIAIVDEEEEG